MKQCIILLVKKFMEVILLVIFFLKIKIGSDPDKDGDLDKMLEWDKQRLSEIHEAVKDIETPYTDTGYVPYYLDANGRYDSKDRLMRFLDHAAQIGIRERGRLEGGFFVTHARYRSCEVIVNIHFHFARRLPTTRR